MAGQLAANHPNDALQYLREAINRGYKDADGLMADTDLEKLRPNSNFLDGNRNPAKNDLQTAVALANADINAQKWVDQRSSRNHCLISDSCQSSGANSPGIENVVLRDRRCIARIRHLREELT